MMQYFVHDFLIESTSINKIKDSFFYHISIYCTHKKIFEEEESEKFYVSVANLQGIAHHLATMQDVFGNNNQKAFFNGPFMIIGNYVEKNVLQLLKDKIESIRGSSKGELIYNLSPYFEWEFLSDPNVVKEFF